MKAPETAQVDALAPIPEGDFDRAAAAHLLRRAAFGASPARLKQVEAAGLEATLDELFLGAAAVRPAKEIALAESLGIRSVVQADLVGLVLAREESAARAAALRERLVWMWHGRFATSDEKVRDPVLMARQIELFRRLALGPFDALVLGVLEDPAMLLWLDGTLNAKGQPNENLARELMELFCLGRGSYSEVDVQEASRGLSGWRVDGRRARFDPRRFDDGAKCVLGRRGALDHRGVASAVLAADAAPLHLARLLVQTFISDGPEPELEAVLAAALRAADLQLDPVLRRLFASKAFFAERLRRQKIASPLEFLARATLALGLEPAPDDAVEWMTAAGQAPLLPPSVEGWHAGPGWIHPSAWLARRRAAAALGDLALRTPALAGLRVSDAVAALWPDEPAPDFLPALERAAEAAGDEAPAVIVETLLSAPQAHRI